MGRQLWGKGLKNIGQASKRLAYPILCYLIRVAAIRQANSKYVYTAGKRLYCLAAHAWSVVSAPRKKMLVTQPTIQILGNYKVYKQF